MADNKKFYWIKLKTDFFNQETIDFLLSQPNGCQYVVLYQMLCLKTANNGGTLATNIGEMIVPYDVNKIVRDTKYFDFDTVTIALGLFKQLGLIYEGNENILKISNFELMVGSESASKEATKKRNQRIRKQLAANGKGEQRDKEGDKLSPEQRDKEGTNCPTEYRVKSLEFRDKSIENREQIIDTRDKSVELLQQQNELDCGGILNLFNAICYSFKPVDKLTETRKMKIIRVNTVLNGDFESFFNRVEKSDFLSGRNGRWNINGTQASFDWIMKLDNVSKIQNGIYDNKENGNGRNSSFSDEDLEFLSKLGTNL